MPYQTLYVTEIDDIVTITLNRSERRNALTPQMIDELTSTLDSLAGRNSGVLILTGRGPAFCAGLDLEHLQSLIKHTIPQHNVDAERMALLLRKLYDLPLPTIAAVNGHAIAGGMGLATVCDFTLAVPEAKFGYTEARIGFVPAMVSTFLTLQVGEKLARDLLLTARLITAEEAQLMGLVNEVVRDSGLMDRALRLARQLLKNSPESLRCTKQLLSSHVKEQLDRQLKVAVEMNANARSTEDFREGLSAFLERRTPQWPSRKRSKAPAHS
ncbi:MAG TPA: enoyl-CoA hydratase-related protein [Candidatus Acidoferrales bacterium]|nr:enoyl-CoA hydratase-related protein [Candidatus Acidoferrales bacterium]